MNQLPSPTNEDRLAHAGWCLAAIVAIAAGLRVYQLGRLSFWYDEVVTMRLARSGSPGALIARLFEIDATRAPLHPMLLHAWIWAFGSSEEAARGFSVLCGLATVLLIFAIARAAFDQRTALWAAWLAAFSPALIVYSREARMYAWLVLVTCLSWWLLLALYRSTHARGAAQVLGAGLQTTAMNISVSAALLGAAPDEPAGPQPPMGLGRTARGGWGRARRAMPPGVPPKVSGLVLALAYAVSSTALIYSHPLGLLMAATLALAGLIGFGSWRRWLAVHLVVAAATLLWIRHYLDHPPEFLSDPPTLRILLGTPIGFIGGDSRVLLGLILLIAWGIARRVLARDVTGRWRIVPESTIVPAFLLLWLILPTMALYLYSRLAHPIFGPARYTLFVAPAYLILVATCLGRLPSALRYPLGLALTILAVSELDSKAYDPGLRADWRESSAAIARDADDPGSIAVIVATSNPGRNVEVETARYYLPSRCEAIALEDATPDRLARVGAKTVYLAIGRRHGTPVIPVPERVGPYRFRLFQDYPGLLVYRAED